uniref:Uncharacterized protein n=1 Tax=Manihot esculenta TaxID=3983 RepID=A0A2C9UF68_MANES
MNSVVSTSMTSRKVNLVPDSRLVLLAQIAWTRTHPT